MRCLCRQSLEQLRMLSGYSFLQLLTAVTWSGEWQLTGWGCGHGGLTAALCGKVEDGEARKLGSRWRLRALQCDSRTTDPFGFMCFLDFDNEQKDKQKTAIDRGSQLRWQIAGDQAINDQTHRIVTNDDADGLTDVGRHSVGNEHSAHGAEYRRHRCETRLRGNTTAAGHAQEAGSGDEC